MDSSVQPLTLDQQSLDAAAGSVLGPDAAEVVAWNVEPIAHRAVREMTGGVHRVSRTACTL